MIARIVIAAVATLFISTMAFGQMKYSRTRSASPTPTPTPALTPMPGLNKAQREMLRPTPAPTVAKPIPQMRGMPTATPAKSMPQIRATPPPVQARSTPPPRAMAAPLQGRAAPAPRATPLPAQPRAMPTPLLAQSTPAPPPAKPTPTPVPPPDVKVYLQRQIATSKDKKFHFTANGKDLVLTPFHVWMQKSTGPNTTSTCIDMTSDEGRIYDIDFLTTGSQVTAIRVHKINGETVR